MIVIDANSLTLLINPSASAPIDPTTGQAVSKIKERFDFFQEQLAKSQDVLLIPTPALSEILVNAGEDAPAILDRFNKSSRFKIVPFDQRAAVEVAFMTREAISRGNKKGESIESWAKVKYDRQIIAIAKVNGASVIYSDDENLGKFAKLVGISVIRVHEMDLPPEPIQPALI